MFASLLLRIGALGPLVLYGVIAAAGLLTPGYDFMTGQVSELGKAGAPQASIFNYGLIAGGAAIAVGGLAMLLALRRLGGGIIMPLLAAAAVAVFGASFVIAGLHPTPDAMHQAYNLGYAGVVAPLLGFLAMGDRSELSGAKTLAVVSFLAAAAGVALVKNVGGFDLVKPAFAGAWHLGLIVATTLWLLPAFLAMPGALAAKERKRAAGF
ncbi:MAG: DUF998 domain-containing protein [Pseudomonadota bacterium]